MKLMKLIIAIPVFVTPAVAGAPRHRKFGKLG